MDNLRAQTDRLIHEIESKLQEIAELERGKGLLKSEELLLRDREKRLGSGEDALRADRATLEQEKEFLKQGLTKLDELAATESRITRERELLTQERSVLAKERSAMQIQQQEFKQTLQEVATLEKAQSDLALRETALKALERAQHARSVVLDQQEEANKREAERLQQIAQKFSA